MDIDWKNIVAYILSQVATTDTQVVVPPEVLRDPQGTIDVDVRHDGAVHITYKANSSEQMIDVVDLSESPIVKALLQSQTVIAN